MSLTVTYVNGEKISNDFVNFIESVEVTDDEETVSLKLKIGYRLQGGGVGVSWIYEYTNPGSFNLTSITTSVVIGILAIIATALIATTTNNEKKTIYCIEEDIGNQTKTGH